MHAEDKRDLSPIRRTEWFQVKMEHSWNSAKRRPVRKGSKRAWLDSPAPVRSYVMCKWLWGTWRALYGELQDLGRWVEHRGRPDGLSLQLPIKQEVPAEVGWNQSWPFHVGE